MRAPLSIVIPTLNAGAALPATLLCAFEGVQAGIVRELVVSDGGSTDQTLSMARDAGAVIVEGAASRGGQLRRGVAATGGEWILILHADTVLSEGWSDVVADAMSGRLASDRAGYFKLAFDASGLAPRWVAGWANFRSRFLGLPYGDQGLLVSAHLLADVGGVPDQPLMEDVALARALRGKLVSLDIAASTSFARYEARGALRQGARNLALLTRYLAGADPEHLAEMYRR